MERVLKTPKELAQAAATFFVECAREAVEARGMFIAAIPGGRTPERFFRLLGGVASMPWENTHLFLTDERFVRSDDPENTERMVRELFADKVPLKGLHPIRTDVSTPEEAARLVSEELKSVGGVFDLVILGVGADGHVASLFPDHTWEENDFPYIAVHNAPKPPPERVSLSLSTINAARNVLILASGTEKVAILQSLRSGEAAHLPVGKVRPAMSETTIFIDEAAAS